METTVTTIPFMCEIPEDQKRLLELKYSVYCDAINDKWCYLIVDNNNKKTIVKGSDTSNDADRLKLIAILNSFENIYSNHDEQLHNHVNIEVYTDSVYCTNVLREWVFKWVSNNFDKRPNADLLPAAHTVMNQHKDTISLKWYPTSSINNLKMFN